MKAFSHFKTITHHKILVMQGCFKVGLYGQGLLHDMSKYSPAEFLVGARYYQTLSGSPEHGCTIRDETSIIMNIGSITVLLISREV